MRRELPQLHKKSGTALVLSGGATKAFYFHIGVMKALQLDDISSIVGTSAGAVAGAMVASGVSPENLIASIYQKEVYIPRFDSVVKNLTSSMMFKPNLGHWAVQGAQTAVEGVKFLFSLPFLCNQDILAEALDRLILAQRYAPGFFNASELEGLFKNSLPSNNFSHTDIDLYVTATSLDSHERAVFNGLYNFADDYNHFITDVPIHKAVRASASIPGMFDPVLIRDKYYIDGEVRQTLSMDIGLALADRVVISHTYHPMYLPAPQSVRDMGWVNILKQTLHIVFYERIAVWKDIYASQFPDKEVIWIEPDPTDEEFFLTPEFSFRPEVHKLLIQRGERAALDALNRNTTEVNKVTGS